MKTMTIQTHTRKQYGFSLVEVMVAMVLSLILLAGVLQIYASSRQSYRMQEALSRVQENGRFAMEFLSRDIRMGDFWGCADFDNLSNNLNPAGGPTYQDFGAGGVLGTDNTGLNGSDTITLSGAYATGMEVLPNGAAGYGPQQSSDLTVDVNNQLNQCDVVVVADCTSADVFQINNANPNGTGQLVHNTGVTCAPGNYNPLPCTGGNAHCLSKVYGGDASIYRVQQLVYNLGMGAQNQPALFVTRNFGAPRELVDGIADMQFEYGEDTDNDKIANYYVPRASVADMNNVVSVRIWLLSRSYEDNLTPAPQTYQWENGPVTAADNRVYQVFTSTVTLRNRVQ